MIARAVAGTGRALLACACAGALACDTASPVAEMGQAAAVSTTPASPGPPAAPESNPSAAPVRAPELASVPSSEVPVQRVDVVSDLKSDEELRLLPAVAVRDGDGWRVTLRAWVFEPEEDGWFRGAAITGLVRALGLPDGSESSEVFRRRARAFLVDNERGKRVVVQIGRKEHVLEATGPNGHSETVLRLEDADLPATVNPVVAVLGPGDARSYAGVVVRLDGAGVSVVSDVDDTIKISEVRDKRRLLERTFLREFEPVPGMAALYRQWGAAGAAFHYLSASPWQLYDAIAGFTGDHQFPAGSLHLKQFRAKDASFLSLFQDPKSYKGPLLRALVAGAPGRRFVLVGDSGELDPEVYADAYREFPEQIAAIYIRDVSDEGPDAPRYRTTFAGVPAERWRIFRDPAEVLSTLP